MKSFKNFDHKRIKNVFKTLFKKKVFRWGICGENKNTSLFKVL
jgi:hypothetical protein